MKLANGDIFNAREPLQKLMEEKLPVKIAYGLAKLGSTLNGQFQIIEQVRNGLIQTYGAEDPENPQQWKVEPGSEKGKKFIKEMDELFVQEVEVPIVMVALPEMVDGVALQVEPQVLMALEKFITVE